MARFLFSAYCDLILQKELSFYWLHDPRSTANNKVEALAVKLRTNY